MSKFGSYHQLVWNCATFVDCLIRIICVGEDRGLDLMNVGSESIVIASIVSNYIIVRHA
jgi:hypothetical protein